MPLKHFLCSDHFEADCFEEDSMLAEEIGLKKRKRLKPDAVPIIFVRPKQATEPGPSKQDSDHNCSQKGAN